MLEVIEELQENTEILRLHETHGRFCLLRVGNSGVRIWKFCNPDPIRKFFIDCISNPYPKI